MPAAPNIVLGVGGGIAAYKVAGVLRTLTESGQRVRVVPTAAALQFVGAATWEALSGEPVTHEVFADIPDVAHVSLGQQADLVLVAPATADLLARASQGLASDLLGNVLLTARCPVLMVPAMHSEMWLHPATVENVATLRRRGVTVMNPAEGRLTGSDSGVGRLPEPEDIVAAARALLAERAPLPRDLVGRRVVISAGGTREYLDPVRYLGNRSSGRQGWALARVAALRGAEVTLVSGPTELTPPAGIALQRVTSAEGMRQAVLGAAQDAHAVVMAAAVADFQPVSAAEVKIKKSVEDPSSVPTLELRRTPDVLAELSRQDRPGRAGQVIVGFAAETGDGQAGVLEHGRRKLESKGCDLLVVNEVGERKGFEAEDNEATILGADGSRSEVGRTSKEAVARAVLDAVVSRLATS